MDRGLWVGQPRSLANKNGLTDADHVNEETTTFAKADYLLLGACKMNWNVLNYVSEQDNACSCERCQRGTILV